MPVPTARALVRKTNMGGVVVAGTLSVVLQLGPDVNPEARAVNLISAQVRRAAGASATNYTQRINNAAGGAAGAISQKWTGAAVAPGTMSAIRDINQPMKTDALGRLYYTVGGDAADDFEYDLWFEVLAV